MNTDKLIITLFAEDRPGVLQAVSDAVREHGGNWLESSLSRLCGQFSGIVCIAVAADKRPGLISALNGLREIGIEITVHQGEFQQSDFQQPEAKGKTVELLIEANDRTGIVEEICSVLADSAVNVGQIKTACESASMAGYTIFRANLRVMLPAGFDIEQLEQILENVSDDLMVSIMGLSDNNLRNEKVGI